VGASTLTQQLAKQLFHGEGSKFYPLDCTKKSEMDYHSIEKTIYKNEILAMYCNIYDLGIFLLSSAAQTYFSKEPKNSDDR
jgi:penicillin-binding protein 1A